MSESRDGGSLLGSWIGWNRQTALVTGIIGVLVVSVVFVGIVPGVLEDPRVDDEPGLLRITEVTVAAEDVTGESVTLVLDSRLAHRGGVSENVTIEFRASHRETGLIATTHTQSIGDLSETGERSITADIVVPRNGGYIVDIIVFQDGERVSSTSREIRGVGTLKPAYAESTVGFHQFEERGDPALPVITYSIAATNDDRTTLSVSAYLTNTGDTPVGGHELVMRARQADSNIIAAESSVTIDPIPPGETAQPTVELTVPSEYNYYLDALLWKNGVLVDDAIAAANLDPTREISVNRTREEVGLEVSDFERSPSQGGAPVPTPSDEMDQPGFGIGIALAAIVIGGIVSLRRRSV